MLLLLLLLLLSLPLSLLQYRHPRISGGDDDAFFSVLHLIRSPVVMTDRQNHNVPESQTLLRPFGLLQAAGQELLYAHLREVLARPLEFRVQQVLGV